MKKIHILLVVLLSISFFSCKDFLDEEPTDSGDAQTAVKTPADAKVIINGLMRNMTDFNYYGRNFIMYGDAKGGDLTISSQGRGLDAFYTFNHGVNTNSYSGFWSHIYSCIMQTNSLLEGIDRVQTDGPIAGFDTYKGQALTARAMMYFDLVRLYGKSYDDDKTSYGVPNITTTLSSSDQPLRASVEENYAQIIEDLTAAAPLLPKTKTNGYINYYANLALQSRVYLYMKDYANALRTAEELISSNVYAPYNNAMWVESWRTQFNTESIFELGVFVGEGDLETGSLGFYLRRREHGGSGALGWFMASDSFLQRLRQDPSDIRLGIMSYDETSNTRQGSLYKYSGSTTLFGDGKATSTAVNIKVIRLSEMYLIAAESALASDKAKAATYLNTIRRRSPALAPATAEKITLDMIVEERSKELFGEGHRFFDMIRLNRTITFNDDFGDLTIPHRETSINRSFYKTRLPISQDEINANPGMKAQQNEGY